MAQEITRSVFLEGVSRSFYGQGAEGNGETPVGSAGQLRPRRALLEEAQRPPHGKRSFSRNPQALTIVSNGVFPEKQKN